MNDSLNLIDEILDLPKKSSETREASIIAKGSTIKYNSISTGTSENILWSNSSIQMWSTSKDWKTGYVVKTGPTEKFFENKRNTHISGPQLRIKNQIMAYRWTFRIDPLKLENILWAIHN